MHDCRKSFMLTAFQVHRATESNTRTYSFGKMVRLMISHTEQQEQLRQLLMEFNQVFQNQPGQTQLAEHKIDTGSAHSDCLHIDCHKLTAQELQEMLA